MLLYRGVSKKMDSALNGKLIPKGDSSEVTARYDGKIKYDGTFTYGMSENNAARAQQIESGLYDNCFISTTKNEKMAILFATNKFTEPGFVYVLDSSLFSTHHVRSKEFPDPLYPSEMEISIRDVNCGPIPNSVIISKYEVDIKGIKTEQG